MRIIGHGIDLTDTARIERMLADHGDRFLERCFTEVERQTFANDRREIEHLAGRFAAKEAVVKAMGTGFSNGISMQDVEILRDANGRPRVALHGRAEEISRRLGVAIWHVSISHIATQATASAIAEGLCANE